MFSGLFHVNEIPKKIQTHKFLVVHDSNHWGVIHKNLLKEIELFDSIGRDSPLAKAVMKHFDGVKIFTCNQIQLQTNKSALCGEYVIYFIIKRFYDSDIWFSDFINLYFSTNEEKTRKSVKVHSRTTTWNTILIFETKN